MPGGVAEAFGAVAVSASGASDSGPARGTVLSGVLAGRSRGSGMGSDGRAASMPAIATLKQRVATAIGRKVFTIPPKPPTPCRFIGLARLNKS